MNSLRMRSEPRVGPMVPASSSSLVTLQLEEWATITNAEEADAVFFSPAAGPRLRDAPRRHDERLGFAAAPDPLRPSVRL